MSLTKTDVVEMVFEQLDCSKTDAKRFVESLIEIIKAEIEAGNDVLVSNFGKFCVKNKKERRGRNPATGGELMLEPRKIVTFKCSASLREKIQER